MKKSYLIAATAFGLMSSALCRADIVVNYGLPSGCPASCLIGSGQPDLTIPGTDTQQFTLTSPVDITSITFWTYEAPSALNVQVDWTITDALNDVVGSGSDSTPQRDTQGLVTNFNNSGTDLGLGLEVAMITVPTALIITPNPGPENYTLSLLLHGAQSSYFWAEAADDQHYAFQLIGTESAVVPEPSFVWLAGGGLGLLAAFRIRRKR